MAKDLKQNNRNTIITTEKKEALRAHREEILKLDPKSKTMGMTTDMFSNSLTSVISEMSDRKSINLSSYVFSVSAATVSSVVQDL